MTPLLGTKTSSVPVGDAPAGDNKAAQATAFQVFMRPETQDAALAGREAQASANSEVSRKTKNKKLKTDFEVLHEIPITSHESRPFFPPETGFYRVKPGLCRLIATFYRIITGQKPAIPHNSSEFVGIIRIATSAPSRCPRTVRIGNTACRVFTRHETRITALPVHRPSDISSGANQAPQPWFSRNTRHETRITAFMLFTNHGLYAWPFGSLWVGRSRTARNRRRTAAPSGKSLFSSSPLFAVVHYCSPLFGKNIVRSQCPLSVHTGNAACKVFTKHETRNTAFMAARSLLSCALWRNGCAAMAWLWSGCGACGAAVARLWRWSGMGGRGAPWAAYCPRASVLAPSAVLGRPHDGPRSLGNPTKVRRIPCLREAARGVPLPAAPVALRVRSAAGERRMNPCRERRTFWIAPTGALSILR